MRSGSAEQRQQILEWCKANTLAPQARYVGFLLLRSDPSLGRIREDLGLPADPVKFGEELSRGGIVTYGGRHWGAVELREKLLRDGYELLEGRWHRKREQTIRVPGLFEYARQDRKTVQISSTSAPECHEEEVTTKVVQDALKGTYSEEPVVKLLRRFHAPVTPMVQPVRAPGSYLQLPAGTPVTGEVAISVALEAPLLEGSVMTLAETRGGAPRSSSISSSGTACVRSSSPAQARRTTCTPCLRQPGGAGRSISSRS